MINSNELRLGITLYDNLRKKEVTISKKHLREFLIDEASFVKRYLPVGITEEKLVKCGFEKLCDWFFIKNILKLEIFNDRNYTQVRLIKSINDSTELTTIQYLHQLQSLFIDLTKTELKYENN